MDGLPLTRKCANGHQTAGPRTGMFPQLRPTASDTACSVKGLLGSIRTVKLLLGRTSSNLGIIWSIVKLVAPGLGVQ